MIMVRNNVMISLDENKIKYYKEYCEKTGRALSKLVEVALDDYINQNPINEYKFN